MNPMEEAPQTPSPPGEETPAMAQRRHYSTVDTSRPFRSVKEAVAIFGERLLAGDLYSSPKPFFITTSTATTPRQYSPWKFSPSSIEAKHYEEEEQGRTDLHETVKKLQAELEETKAELRLLKKREEETEVALASLNAELHRNMSKVARAEAAAAAAAAAAAREEEKKRDLAVRMAQDSPTLAKILSLGQEEESLLGMRKERKKMKKKPIVPLLGDLFSRKKRSSASLHSSLFSSTHVYLN
ncbi:hypothetical protein NMG60_11032538 [Bertholletia excelsa]